MTCLKHTAASVLFLLCTFLSALAIPADRKVYVYTQPDGTGLQVYVSGDEFFKDVTTLDGAAVVLDEDGFYCYASFLPDGSRISTGVHAREFPIGMSLMETQAAAAARNIPYDKLLSISRHMRLETFKDVAPISLPPVKSGPVTIRVPVILAQFSDQNFKFSKSDFDDLLHKKGYSVGGAYGSVEEYFESQFDGRVDFEFELSNVFTLGMGYSHYGRNGAGDFDVCAPEAVAEACAGLDGMIDFSRYDNDGDGTVDFVFVFVPGAGESEGAGEDRIWPHSYNVLDAGINLSLDGVKIGRYAISTELFQNQMTGISFFCHEFSHCLGLLDQYDSDYKDSGGQFESLSTASLMDHGCYNNNGRTPPNYSAFELERLGIGQAETLSMGEFSLNPIGERKIYCRYETDTEGEYYLFEYRSMSGWDKYIGGSGMLIYHVDKSSNPSGFSSLYGRELKAWERWALNEVNCNPVHPCCDIVCASKSKESSSSYFWPFGRYNVFSPESSYPFAFWNGHIPEISLTNISDSSDILTFSVTGPLSFRSTEVFQDALISRWTVTGAGEDALCSVELLENGESVRSLTVKPYAPNQYSVRIDNLLPKTKYRICIKCMEKDLGFIYADVTTKAFYAMAYPFIYLNSALRNDDGTFPEGSSIPLQVFNARDAVEIIWRYPEDAVVSDGSGYYSIRKSCRITAEIRYLDGSTDVVTKNLLVK